MYVRSLIVVFLSCGLGTVPGVAAQPAGFDAGGSVYRLKADATFQEGCFDPCLCPLGAEQPVRGTFALGPPVIGDVVDFRALSQVNWTVGDPGTTLHTITGRGGYRVTNYGPPRQHALELELSLDGGETQYFFSDFVPLDVNDGSIDLRVSMNGMVCDDVVIRVSAAPVPSDEVRPYGLVRGSTYQQGCFDPCDCILEEPVPMRGRFGLVELYDFGTYAEYSIVNARFGVRADSLVNALHTYAGAGRYILVQGFAGPIHAMELTLQTPVGDRMFFESGLANTDTLFPAIDIVLSMNDMVCFDRILTLRARPPAHMAPMPLPAR